MDGRPPQPPLSPCPSHTFPEQGPRGTEEGLPCAGGGVCQPPGPRGPLRAEPPGRPEEDPAGLAAEHLLARQEGEDSRGPTLPEGGWATLGEDLPRDTLGGFQGEGGIEGPDCYRPVRSPV